MKRLAALTSILLLAAGCARPVTAPATRNMRVAAPEAWTGGDLTGDNLAADW